jgi:hypothetical protein
VLDDVGVSAGVVGDRVVVVVERHQGGGMAKD